MDKKLEISEKTILLTLLLLLAAWVIIKLNDVLILLFLSFIIMSALDPLVDRLQRAKLPRSLSIIIVYVILWLVLGSLLAGLVPGLIDQTGRFIRILPQSLNQIEFFNVHQQEISQQTLAYVSSIPENFLKFVVNLFGNLVNFLSTLVISFYLLLYRPHLEKYLSTWIGQKSAEKTTKLIGKIEQQLGSWVRGELVLMIAVGVLTYVGLVVLGVDTALPLAILAGLLEIVPNIGPTLSAIPAILIALTIHPLTAAGTIALYFIVQFLENNLLVPKIMQKAVGVNPIMSIVGLMIGVRLAGAAGALLAIPVTITLQAIIPEISNLRNSTEK